MRFRRYENRAWLYLTERHSLTFEWSFRRFRFGLTLSEYDDQLTLAISFILGSLYISSTWPRWLVKRMYEHEIGFRVHDGCLWISPFKYTMGWSRDMPWWERGFTLHVVDWLIGKPKYSSQDVSNQAVEIPMPEKKYPATVRMHSDTWARRWYWPKKRILRATVDIPGGIPYPGKGENSWDCGMDGTWGLTCPADSTEDAVRKVVESVTQSRTKYGGKGWLPKESDLVL